MNAHAYFDVVRRDPAAAMIPFGIVQELLGLSRSAVVDRVKAGELSDVTIRANDTVYRGVSLSSLDAYVERLPKPASDEERVSSIEAMIVAKVTATESSKPDAACLRYAEVMEPLGMSWRNPKDRREIGRLLDKMSRASAADPKLRFMMSAAVVRKATGEPGEGFYGLGRDLGLLEEDGEEEAFWRAQLKALCRHYRKR